MKKITWQGIEYQTDELMIEIQDGVALENSPVGFCLTHYPLDEPLLANFKTELLNYRTQNPTIWVGIDTPQAVLTTMPSVFYHDHSRPEWKIICEYLNRPGAPVRTIDRLGFVFNEGEATPIAQEISRNLPQWAIDKYNSLPSGMFTALNHCKQSLTDPTDQKIYVIIR